MTRAGIVLDFRRHRVIRDSRVLRFKRSGFRLVSALLLAGGDAIRRGDLVEHVYGDWCDGEGSELAADTISVLAHHVRGRLPYLGLHLECNRTGWRMVDVAGAMRRLAA